MGVERDIAGIALFFIAGTAAGEMLCRTKFMSWPYSSSAATVILAATAALVFLLIYIRYRHKNPLTAPTSCNRYMKFIIPSAFLMAGLSGATADFLSCGIRSHDAFPPSASLRNAVISNSESFKAAIDAIPFGDKDCNALTKALLSGDKSDVSREINSAFRDSGASHILALSGMHLGVLYWILLKVTSVFGNFRAIRKVRSCLVILISAWYTLITGASASLVRALLFITLNEAAKMAGRETRPMNIFFIALVIQLTIAPSNVMGAGFQLSYLAILVSREKRQPLEMAVGHFGPVHIVPDIHRPRGLADIRVIPQIFSSDQSDCRAPVYIHYAALRSGNLPAPHRNMPGFLHIRRRRIHPAAHTHP